MFGWLKRDVWRLHLRQAWRDFIHFRELKTRFRALRMEWTYAERRKRCTRCAGRRILLGKPGAEVTYHMENVLGHFCTRCGRGYKRNLFDLLDLMERKVLTLTPQERVQPAKSD